MKGGGTTTNCTQFSMSTPPSSSQCRIRMAWIEKGKTTPKLSGGAPICLRRSVMMRMALADSTGPTGAWPRTSSISRYREDETVMQLPLALSPNGTAKGALR